MTGDRRPPVATSDPRASTQGARNEPAASCAHSDGAERSGSRLATPRARLWTREAPTEPRMGVGPPSGSAGAGAGPPADPRKMGRSGVDDTRGHSGSGALPLDHEDALKHPFCIVLQRGSKIPCRALVSNLINRPWPLPCPWPSPRTSIGAVDPVAHVDELHREVELHGRRRSVDHQGSSRSAPAQRIKLRPLRGAPLRGCLSRAAAGHPGLGQRGYSRELRRDGASSRSSS